MDNDARKPTPVNQPADDQVDVDELVNTPPPAQDPASPQSMAPQLQDEEAEKELTAEQGAGVEPAPAAEDILGTDNQTAKEQSKGGENDQS